MSNKKNIPEDYFSKLPHKIIETINNLEDDFAVAPILSKIGNKIDYLVPENYFNELSQKLKNNNVKEAKYISLKWYSVAAAFIIIMGSIFVFNETAGDPEIGDIQDIAFEDLIDIYLDDPFDLDENTLLEIDENISFVSQIGDISDEELDLFIELNIDQLSVEEINELF